MNDPKFTGGRIVALALIVLALAGLACLRVTLDLTRAPQVGRRYLDMTRVPAKTQLRLTT